MSTCASLSQGMLMLVYWLVTGPGEPGPSIRLLGPGHTLAHPVTIRGVESQCNDNNRPGPRPSGHHQAYLKLMPGFSPGQEVIVVTNFHVWLSWNKSLCKDQAHDLLCDSLFMHSARSGLFSRGFPSGPILACFWPRLRPTTANSARPRILKHRGD